MVDISEPGPRLRPSDIAAFEAKVGVKFPDAYRAFLLRNNGGRPDPDVVDIDGLAESPSDVQLFFGLGDDVESCDLEWNLTALNERCPMHGTLPIATDSGGNPYCIKLDGPDHSAIVYCDLGNGGCDFYAVADSFAEFLDKIREWDG